MLINVVLLVLVIGLSILVYYRYNSTNKVEKEKQEEIDKEIAAGWEELEAEMSIKE